MQEFSLIEHNLPEFKAEVEAAKLLQPAAPWSKKQSTPEAVAKRIAKAKDDFWYFDKVYFPKEMYRQGYYAPGKFHKKLLKHAFTPGVQAVLGARDCGKTVTFKKILVWALLTGRIMFAGTYSENLPIARGILDNVEKLITINPRITNDYQVSIITDDKDVLQFCIAGESQIRTVRAYSGGRSLKGASEIFDRPEFLLCDDIETRQSSMEDEQVEARIKELKEAYKSLSSNGTAVVLGNNFDRQCALNRLLTEQEEGILPEHWRVHVYPAWCDETGALWPERYKATTEAELKVEMKAADDEEWDGDFQQDPTPAKGYTFKKASYKEWTEIPGDARGIMYCDPNLSLKSKGDTTAIGALLYSPTTDMYYIPQFRCRSLSDPNLLLDILVEMRQTIKNCYTIGFDGWVTQESVWTNNVRNWCKIRNTPAPRIEYRRYHVEMLAKNVQGVWNEGRILFPPGFIKTEEGKTATRQMFAFKGKKKAGKKDDAPDVLICLYELIHERGIARKTTAKGGYRSVTESSYL